MPTPLSETVIQPSFWAERKNQRSKSFRKLWEKKRLICITLPKHAVIRTLTERIIKKLGKELMSQDELSVMDGGKCILQLRGVRPFLSDKYDITNTLGTKCCRTITRNNAFDMEKYMKHRKPILAKDEVFDYYKIDLPEVDIPTAENKKYK